MFQALLQILGKLGGKIFAKVGSKLAAKGAEKLAQKGAEQLLKKGAEKVGTKVLGKVLSKASDFLGSKGGVAQGGGDGLSAQMAKGVDNNGVWDAVKQVSGGKRKTLKTIWNIVGGNFGKNANEIKGTAINNPVDSLRNSAEIDKLNNMNLQPMQSRFSNLGNSAITARMKNAPKESNSLYDILDKIKSSKAGQAGQKLLGGDSYGSKLFLNTLSNMGQQGAFSGSDVGQPDKNFFGMLGNSVAMGLGDASKEQRHQNFQRDQTVMNMVQDFNVSEDIFKEWGDTNLKKINNFKGSAVDMMFNNRKRGLSGLSSEDMMKLSNQYVGVKKDLVNFQDGINSAQDAQQKIMSTANAGRYDQEKFNSAIDYLRTEGRAPAQGFLYAASWNPEVHFQQEKVGDYRDKSQQDPYIQTTGLSEKDKALKAIELGLSSPNYSRFAKENGYDLTKAESAAAWGKKYGPLLAKDYTEYDKLNAYLDRKDNQAEISANRASKEQEKRGWDIQGGKVILTRDKTENILKNSLQDPSGAFLGKPDSNEALPVKFETVNPDGSATVSTTIKDADNVPSMQRLRVPPDKAKDLVESFYPGAYGEATKLYKAPKEPTGVYSPDVEDKITLYMEANPDIVHNRDEAVARLKALKKL